MENKVSDNVIEKNYRECLKFNEINESKVDNFDLAIAKAALENLYELYKNGILTGRFTQDKDYVVRCDDLVTLAEENKDSLFYDAWRVWFRYFVSMGYAGWKQILSYRVAHLHLKLGGIPFFSSSLSVWSNGILPPTAHSILHSPSIQNI